MNVIMFLWTSDVFYWWVHWNFVVKCGYFDLPYQCCLTLLLLTVMAVMFTLNKRIKFIKFIQNSQKSQLQVTPNMPFVPKSWQFFLDQFIVIDWDSVTEFDYFGSRSNAVEILDERDHVFMNIWCFSWWVHSQFCSRMW